MTDPLAWLADDAAARRAAHTERSLVSRRALDPVLDLASNDYLALSRHPEVVDAAVQALHAYGAGSTGSRLVTGTTDLHGELEQALAAATGFGSALVFSSGYLANLGAITALAGRTSLVVSDRANHASLVDACRLSGARLVVTSSLDDVGTALSSRAEESALVVTDAVFSVSGRLAPLADLHAVARRYGAVLVVDEAHSLGVVAPGGACAALGLAGQPDVVATATLSKALSSQGGAVLGPPAVRRHLVSTARSFIFDTALAPASVGAALAALRLADAQRVGDLRATSAALADALGVARTAGAVVPVPTGTSADAAAARDRCLADGVRVGCFRPPSVPDGQACLRLTARADLTDEDVALAAKVVRDALR